MYPKNGRIDSVSATRGGRVNKTFTYDKALLCTPQQRRRYVSNETLNNVSVERYQDISVVCVDDDVLRGRNNYVPLVCFYNV